MSPRVSIVIPTFNAAHFLRHALTCVTQQTFSDWECFVINNFSDDDTEELVQSLADPRILLINFRNHGVIAASRNEGARRAQGEWLAFLDADDLWRPEKLQKCSAHFASADVIAHDMRMLFPNHHTRFHCGTDAASVYRHLLYQGNVIATSGCLVRKLCFDEQAGFSEALDTVTAEDYDLWLRLARAGRRFYFLNQKLGSITVSDQSASRSVKRHLSAALAVINKHHATLERRSPFDGLRFRKATAYHYAGNAKVLLRQGKRLEALRLLMRGVLAVAARGVRPTERPLTN